MEVTQEVIERLTKLVGTPYEKLDCWRLVRLAYAAEGVALPDDYFSAAQTMFRTLRDTETRMAFDVVVIRNHQILTNHCGLYLGDGKVLHSMQDSGVVCQPIERIARIVGFLRLKH